MVYYFEKLTKVHCVQSIPRLTHSGASTHIAHVYECLPYFHDLFTPGSPNTVERPGKSPAIRILSADILSLPYRYDDVSDTVKYWIHKKCKHFDPNSAQVELMSQIVSSAMRPGCRVGTSSKRATRIHQHDHAYHSSAKLGGHQQVRYHRYVRFAIGTHHRDNFLGWLMFISCRCLVYWTCCACSSWWYLDWEAVCCWRDRNWWSLCQHVAWVHDPLQTHRSRPTWQRPTHCGQRERTVLYWWMQQLPMAKWHNMLKYFLTLSIVTSDRNPHLVFKQRL